MKKFLAMACIVMLTACNNNDEDDNSNNGIVGNYRDDMREFVIGISQKAKSVRSGFAVIPQNGIELVSSNGDEDGMPVTTYLNAVDGNGQEDLFFGYVSDDEPTPAEDNAYLRGLLNISKNAGKTILVTDYVSTPYKITSSYQQNQSAGYVSFAATERALNTIPAGQPHNVNTSNITSLSQAKNFLYLINPENFASKQAFISAVAATNYDALIMDLFFEGQQFTPDEIQQLKQKANGGTRMVICYMSIGEAENYRYYWESSWTTSPPSWLAAENPDWPGNYKVRYWNADWQGIIYKNNDSYLDRIITTGFDGVYLDIIDAFEFFEGAS
ncbi:endo alpha-1,4 polygalactosaminidase [Flavobacterium sp. J372]|uniref:endo alpha-1,4 polygalactosaminidase n=1 Tax=Flavobacterium sp. J372 TaxID=2898436 RepID=UPI002151878A|nr:endo alpha-1,4 polygalactosaminidase [Flavobacterium sp. J372]MCR5862190.1 endo alpha-1,4 polygalactosaminidase [Flavobacterium sp. J372]